MITYLVAPDVRKRCEGCNDALMYGDWIYMPIDHPEDDRAPNLSHTLVHRTTGEEHEIHFDTRFEMSGEDIRILELIGFPKSNTNPNSGYRWTSVDLLLAEARYENARLQNRRQMRLKDYDAQVARGWSSDDIWVGLLGAFVAFILFYLFIL